MDLRTFLGNSPELWLIIAAPLGLLLLLIVFFAGGGEQRQIAKRITRIKKSHAEKPTPIQIISARRKTASGGLPAVEKIIKRWIPRQEMLRLRLIRA